MPSAVTFNGNITKGVALDGLQISPRRTQEHRRKFWGVQGESDIDGKYGGREIAVPVMIYDADNVDFNTARKLSDYIDVTLNTTRKGTNGTLQIHSESDHAAFSDCKFQGAELIEGPKQDVGGNLGGGFWAICMFHYHQLS